jgi:hypothetical protein
MFRRGQPETPALAVARWQLRTSGDTQDSFDDAGLLAWSRRRSADSGLGSVQARRDYERSWIGAEEAVRRVRLERAEVLGARIGAVASILLVPPLLVLLAGGSGLHALGLAFGLSVCGTTAILRRGADVIMRALMLQAFGTVLGMSMHANLFVALLVGAYVPAAATAAAAYLGGRLGTWSAQQLYGKQRRTGPAIDGTTAQSSGSRDAVAA